MGTESAPRLHVLSEASALRFAWEALTGRRPYVVAVEPILPPLAGLLERLSRWALVSGRARPAHELCPDMRALYDYPTRILLHDVFGRLEEWQNGFYGFADADLHADRLAMAYKKVTCNHVRWKHLTVLVIDAALKRHPDACVVGVQRDTSAILDALRGQAGASAPVGIVARIVNMLLWAGLTAYALLWTLARTRPKVVAQDYFLAVDYIADPRDYELYDELAEGGPVLLVARNKSWESHPEVTSRFRLVHPEAGLLGPGQAAGLLGDILRDAATIRRWAAACEPPMFYALAALPYRRALLRALFSRFRPKFFWGRDDYNVEHVIRRQEINRIGGKSHGIIHGYPAYSILFPMWRYVDFDHYYIFGRALYDRYMKETWAKDMAVTAVGTFGASRARYGERFLDRPADIVVFTAVLVGEPGLVEFVRGLAAAFPDRRVLLQVKHLFIDQPLGKEFVAACREGLDNVVPVREPMLDLFTKARYCFSDPSTVVVEAIQFGLYSFNIDISKIQKVSLLREFPDLCVRSAEQAIARVRSIEDGSWRYPRESFADLVDLSGRTVFDVVRQDMGLPAKEAPVPLPDLSH